MLEMGTIRCFEGKGERGLLTGEWFDWRALQSEPTYIGRQIGRHVEFAMIPQTSLIHPHACTSIAQYHVNT